MHNLTKTLLAGSVLIASATLAPALYAHGPGGSGEHEGSMMGSDMMGMMSQMNEMMDGCNAMMQGAIEDGSGKPNEQWREDAPGTPGTNG